MKSNKLPVEVRFCVQCNRNTDYRRMWRGRDATEVEVYAGCCDCFSQTYTPAEHVMLLETAETRLRGLEVPFGKVAGEIGLLHYSWQEAAADIDAFGAPPECMSLVMRGAGKKELAVLAAYGLTADMYQALLTSRCDTRQVYMLGLRLQEQH